MNLNSANTNVRIHCNDDFLQQPSGPDTPWINTVDGKTYDPTQGQSFNCASNGQNFAYVFDGRVIVICPLAWAKIASKGGFVVSAIRNADHTGTELESLESGSAILLHELLHVANVVFQADGSVDRFVGAFSYTLSQDRII